MCGISGILSPISEKHQLVNQSIEEISHRGPDEQGFYLGENCTLGMCRLAILDVAHGQQPSFNANKTVVSVFNGEIYNFRELQQLLRMQGVNVDSSGDSALIPYLYEAYGSDFPQLLQGMFAIAVYDIERDELVLARDRLGKKPLWYSPNKDLFAFSSELKGLFRLGVRKEVETRSLEEYLRFGYINTPRSAYRNVFQVPPASIMTLCKNQISISEYWSTSDSKEISISFPEAVEETERLIRQAVKSRLVSERPIGAFLSGGIDSTIVTALMQEESESRVHSFSIGFSDPKFDESHFSRQIAEIIGTIHHEKVVQPQPELILNELGKMLDHPFADSSIIPMYLLSKFAREKLVVALSGDGGDEAFAGYARYRAGLLLNTINPILTLNPSRLLPTNRVENSRIRKLLRHSNRRTPKERYRGFQSLLENRDIGYLLNPELIGLNTSDDFDLLWNSLPTENLLRKMQEMDFKTYLPGDLMYKVDISSMANSLEVRSPFLDFRVVEFGLSLPNRFKIQNGESKFILREIARKYVPAKLVNRPKMGFAIPRGRWLREELRTMVWDVLLDESSRNRGWYQQENLKKVLMKHQSGVQLDSTIWPIFMLELWARNWID